LIEFADLVGIQSKELPGGLQREITIFTTVFEANKNPNDRNNRKLVEYHFFANSITNCDGFRDYALGQLWQFSQQTYGSGISPTDQTYEPDQTLKSYEKKVLVIVCPRSGAGKADALFREARPWLESNGFVIEILTTTHHNHAAEHMAALDADTMKSYYALICFSGDGVYHELLNGFYKRPDHATLSLRLAGALGGGACGMALNALKEWKLTKTILNVAYVFFLFKLQRF
jgi:hypothetical protein